MFGFPKDNSQGAFNQPIQETYEGLNLTGQQKDLSATYKNFKPAPPIMSGSCLYFYCGQAETYLPYDLNFEKQRGFCTKNCFCVGKCECSIKPSQIINKPLISSHIIQEVAKYGSQVLDFDYLTESILNPYSNSREIVNLCSLTSHPYFENYSSEEVRRIDMTNKKKGVNYQKNSNQFNQSTVLTNSNQVTNNLTEGNKLADQTAIFDLYSAPISLRNNPSNQNFNSAVANNFAKDITKPIESSLSETFNSKYDRQIFQQNLNLVKESPITQENLVYPKLCLNNISANSAPISNSPLYGQTTTNPKERPLSGQLDNKTGGDEHKLNTATSNTQSLSKTLFEQSGQPLLSNKQPCNQNPGNDNCSLTFGSLKFKIYSLSNQLNTIANKYLKQDDSISKLNDNRHEKLNELLKVLEDQINQTNEKFIKKERNRNWEYDLLQDKLRSSVFISNSNNILKRNVKSNHIKSFLKCKQHTNCSPERFDMMAKIHIAETNSATKFLNSCNTTGPDKHEIFPKIIEQTRTETYEIPVRRVETRINVIILNYDVIIEVACCKKDTVKVLKSAIISEAKLIDSLIQLSYLLSKRQFLVIKIHNILKDNQLLQDLSLENGDIFKVLILENNVEFMNFNRIQENYSKDYDTKQKFFTSEKSKHVCEYSKVNIVKESQKTSSQFQSEEPLNSNKKVEDESGRVNQCHLAVEKYAISFSEFDQNSQTIKLDIKRRYPQSNHKIKSKRRCILMALVSRNMQISNLILKDGIRR